ncbi:TMV resistance protein N-like [Prunus avium]|uniref:TMV resistance protein N-like n=1 Tax=Prunus avium TaxID=42229 RepID=A0A6P5U4K5_PRUAV|nr:TMV resistance protein N-like [Prunus avium]
MECKYKDNMEKVNRWREALSQAANLSGFTLLDEHQSESKFIQNIIEEISKHVLNLVCLEVAKHPVGMQAQVQFMNKLIDLGENDVRMVGVWGTGGIGKTTIAKAVYNSIAHKFEGCSFLANVRERSTSHEGLAKLQKTLLFEILRGKKLKVTNVDKGVTMIKEWLRRRKVLLVLDDVDDMEQLHELVGACDWFGAGSRIIITTRDKQMLTAHDVNLIHEVKILDDDKALELFSWYAFKRSGPPFGDYVKLTERAIRYAQGLPLALKVLGSCLYGGSIDKWEAALDGFKSKKIQDVLKISYNALDHSVQQVFLDIACFFKGKSRNYVTEACELNTRYGIEVLIEKALISVEHGDYIQMHDLLEKMGKDIIEQESPTELGKRSRLWFHEDVKHVLTNNTGTNKITGIVLNFPKQDDEIFLNVGRSFSKMKNLKILINYNVYLFGDPSSIPNNLRVLEWHGCPFQSFPANFRPEGLVVLNLPDSRIKQLGEGLKHLTKLTSLNFEGSQFLIEIPDLSGCPNLRYLNAKRCTSLVEVHPSVGYLDKLEELDFCFCLKLSKFPNKVGLKSLRRFFLISCIKLESFPEIVDKMESLNELDLWRTPIKELPASIGHLIGLKRLGLRGSAIKELPSFVGNLTTLKELSLGGTAIEELPSSIGNLTALERLDLEGCENLANLPQSIYGLQNLKWVCVSDCISLERFSTLSKILEDGDMQGISYMDLSNCHRLCRMPGLDVSKMAKIVLNNLRRHEGILFKLPVSGSEVPEWFTFRNYFDDYDESKFDYIDDYGRTVRNYKLPIEIPWTSILENTKLVLCAVWEITESFVNPCSLRFELYDYLDTVDVSRGEIGAGNVWLECFRISYYEQLKTPTFRVKVSGQGLRIKSIGAHLAPVSMSMDGDDDGKHIDENELGDEVRPRTRTKI